jgi:hypothetical protein
MLRASYLLGRRLEGTGRKERGRGCFSEKKGYIVTSVGRHVLTTLGEPAEVVPGLN